MTPWKLSLYSPKPGVRPVEDWYEYQSDEVRAEFDLAMDIFCAHKEWADANGIRILAGKYLGLYEIMITFDIDEDEHSFGVIGKWKAESNQFVLFNVCNRYSDDYNRCLDRALEYSRAWDRKDPQGDVYAYDVEQTGEE